MAECIKCSGKDKEIAELRGLVEFHRMEAKGWRKLFSDQRGGEVYNELQRRYADQNVENSQLRARVKKLEAVNED